MTETTSLAPLLYRTGIWMSHVDDVENRQTDDRHEVAALQQTLDRVERMGKTKPFAAGLIREVKQRKKEWPQWRAKIEEKEVLDDLHEALTEARDELTAAQRKEYKQLVWHIAITIAQAFNEDKDPDGELMMNHFFEWVGEKLSGPRIGRTPENISLKEQKALDRLKKVLRET